MSSLEMRACVGLGLDTRLACIAAWLHVRSPMFSLRVDIPVNLYDARDISLPSEVSHRDVGVTPDVFFASAWLVYASGRG